MSSLICRFIVTLTFLASVSNSFGANLPDILVGDWQVSEAHLNTSLGRTTEYAWDDPRLKGRIFTFSRNDVISDASDDAGQCRNAFARQIDTSFQDLMSRSVSGYAYPASRDSHPARDYKLDIDDSTHVQAISILCSNGVWQGDLGTVSKALGSAAIQGAWIVMDGDKTMLLRWRDETILILKKVSGDAPIHASFPCNKASTPAEHAICRSPHLAAFDQSIADAFRTAMKDKGDTDGGAASVSRDQRQWIKQRDRCGADSSCILKSMRTRLDALTGGG